MAVPYTFQTATGSIPLSQLDSNFSTAITIGNTAVILGETITTINNLSLANVTISSVASAFPNNYLANSNVIVGTTTLTLGSTVTSINGLSLSNVTISSGNVTISNVTTTNVTATTANVTTANVGTLVVIGNETVGGNTTVTGNITAAKGTFTSANVTGTANVQVIAVTQNATVAGNVTITGNVSAANGTFTSANVSGAANVSTLAVISNATIGGNVTVTGNVSANIVTVAAGTAALPAITTTGDTNTGIFFPAADTVGVSTGGSERLRVDSSGNVGIAQTDPTTNGVSGFNNLVIGNSASTAAGITLRASNATTPTTGIVWARNTGGANGFVKYDQTNEAMQFGVAGVEKMRITSAGDVGIGTSTPAAKLDVSGAMNTAGLITNNFPLSSGNIVALNNTNGERFIVAGDSGGIYLGTTAASAHTALRIIAADNVIGTFTTTGLGIGTTSPAAKLDVSGAVKVSGTITSTSGNSTTVFTAASATTGYLLASLINGSGSTYIATSASTGGLGIVGGGAYASTFGSTTNTNIELITNNTVRQTISGAGAIRWNAYGAGSLTTDSSGNVTAVSDERVKTNIRPFSRGAEALRGIAPILHGYTKESLLDQSRDDYAGFSAQNVQQYIPEAVGKMANEMLTLSDRPIIAALVNAFHELDARIKALETK